MLCGFIFRIVVSSAVVVLMLSASVAQAQVRAPVQPQERPPLPAAEKRPISGDLAGDLSVGEYVVTSAITVPAGERLSLRAGTVLYFEQLTGIEVHGELLVNGEPDAPVILTSVSDTAGSHEPAQAFDWNGVKAHSGDAELRLRHTRISNSVYGVSVRDPRTRTELTGVVFSNNGYASLVRGEYVVPVAAGEPFSAAWNIDAVDTPPRRPLPDAVSRKGGRGRLMVQAGSIGTAAVGMTIYAVNMAQMNTYFRHHSLDENPAHISEYYEERIRGNIKWGSIGAVIAGVGLSSLTVSLFF